MDSASTNITEFLVWGLAAAVGIVAAFFLGRLLGKLSVSTTLQVLEERLANKDEILRQQQYDHALASDQIVQLQDDIKDKDILLAELNVRIVAAEKDSEQKLAFVLGARDQLKAEFQAFTHELLEEKSKKITELNQSSLSLLLTPLKDQLTSFSKQVSDVYDKDLRDRISLLKEITELKTMNIRMSDDALNLTRALKGDNKVQGNWGEMVLERVLEMSGLQRDREYKLQPSYNNSEGAVLRPDAVVQLPEGKSVIIDSKVSLKHWERVVAAETNEHSQEALKKHVDSLKSHIKNLSSKQYDSLPELTSLDFVLMFVPIEAAFIKALDADPGLYDLANDKNIMLVCPSTLLATLKAIRHGWQHERQSRNALEIAQRAGALHDQFVLFVEALDDVGDKIGKAAESYDTAHKRLISGRGSLVNRVVQLEELGAKTKKSLTIESREDVEVADQD